MQYQPLENRRQLATAVAPQKSTKAILKQVYAIISEQAPLILITSTVVVLNSILEGLIPYRLSALINKQSESSITGLILIIVLNSILLFMKQYLVTITNEVVLLSLRTFCFAQFLSNDMAFFQKNKVGHLLTLFTSDLETIRSMLTKTLFTLLKNLSRFITIFALLLYLSPILTMILLAFLPFSVYFNLRLTRVSKRYSKSYATANSKALSFVLEVFRGAQIGKTFSNEKEDESRFKEQMTEMQEINKKKAISGASLAGLGLGLGHLSTLVVVCVSLSWMVYTDAEKQIVVAFLLYTLSFNEVVVILSKKGLKMSNGLVSVERMLELLKYQSVIVDSTPSQQPFPHPICFEAVSFYYSQKRGYIIRDFNLTIDYGEYVGIVGPSGCGKSTVLKLLLKLYAPSEGEVRCSFPRQRVAYVPQEAVIFKGTLIQNINYGDISEERVLQICREVGIEDLVQSWPEGLNTKLGSKGVKLSGGQKQRIGLARALSISPDLLLLDQATASLDSKSEDLICNTILAIACRRKITIVSISHHSRKWGDFDRIVVMSQGRIVSVDTPAELNYNQPLCISTSL